MTSPIQSVPLNSSTIPLQLTIDNKIVTWQIIMDLEVKSYVIGTRESAIWADEITGDPLLMMQLSTFQYLIMKVQCIIFKQNIIKKIVSLWESIKSSNLLIKMIS